MLRLRLTLVLSLLLDDDAVDLLFPGATNAEAGPSLADDSLALPLICRGCCFWDVMINGLSVSVFLLAATEPGIDFFRRCGTRPGNSSRRSLASK